MVERHRGKLRREQEARREKIIGGEGGERKEQEREEDKKNLVGKRNRWGEGGIGADEIQINEN